MDQLYSDLRSSIEAGYRSLAYTTIELTWVQMLLVDFSAPLPSSLVLWCDNLSAFSLAPNPVFHSHSKHIEVDCHFVQEKVVAKKLILKYIHANDQIAEVFTKALSTSKFQLLKNKLMIHSPLIRLKGMIRIVKHQ
ncbi:hypothetical protein CsSME_00037998 [Camellia sinensis var. sinensis]